MRFHKSVQMLEKLTIFAIFPSKSPLTFAFIDTYGAIGINSLERVKALILDARLETFYRNIKIYTDLFNIISIKIMIWMPWSYQNWMQQWILPEITNSNSIWKRNKGTRIVFMTGLRSIPLWAQELRLVVINLKYLE